MRIASYFWPDLGQRTSLVTAALGCVLFAHSASGATIGITKHDDCNLFDVNTPVVFEATAQGLPAGSGEAVAVTTNFFGEQRELKIPVTITAGELAKFNINLGTPEPGYYDLKVTLTVKDADGKEFTADSTVKVNRVINPGNQKYSDTDPICFGVVKFVNRTAEEVRRGGYRFGLKLFQVGKEGVWWRKDITYDVSKFVDASCKLGLQWTRQLFNQPATGAPGVIGVNDLLTKYPMNSVLKIEGFPEDCYDVARYGPLTEWQAKHKGKAWSRCTVPKKDVYQPWLKAEIAKLPTDQKIFEIGNELWSSMSGEEFAEWAQMTREAVKDVRPDAKIGADPGNTAKFTEPFLSHGGMNGMDIIYCHPYCFTPLPEHRVRPLLRNQRDTVKQYTGKDLDIYVTEYGWPTAEKDSRGNSVSEQLQAERTTRQSIMMYAEDVKTLIPHWMADRELDITERENWFGFFRLSGEPKPVVIAHAVCAQMIDASRFVGDLWLGNRTGAMLFDRGGQFTLALWSLETPLEQTVDVGVPKVKIVDLMGRERSVDTPGGKLNCKLNGSVIYVAGVSAELEKKVASPTAELNPELWAERSDPVNIPRAKSAPVIDGKLDEWSGTKPIALTNPSGSTADAAATLQWDDKYFYVALKSPSKSGLFKVGLSGMPSRQQNTPSLYDRVIAIQPDTAAGAKVTLEGSAILGKPLELGPKNPDGVRWALTPDGQGWTGELAIPLSFLKGLTNSDSATRLSGRVLFQDGKSQFLNGDEFPRKWPFFVLQK